MRIRLVCQRAKIVVKKASIIKIAQLLLLLQHGGISEKKESENAATRHHAPKNMQIIV